MGSILCTSSIPAVSIIRSGKPSNLDTNSLLSRVRPGVGSVIANYPPDNFLKRELFPTFGLPIRETVNIFSLNVENF